MEDGYPTSRFIGREQELTIFKDWMMNNDPEAPWILYFHDKLEEKKGGVGKTWLLRQCATVAREIFPDITIVSIDFFNIADRDGIVIAEHAVEALKAAYPEWKPDIFDNELVKYRRALSEGTEDAAEVRDRLADALTADLHRLSEDFPEPRKQLLLILDTYEMIERNPEIAVLRLSQAFPDVYAFANAGVVMAGRNRLDWEQINWRGREYEVRNVAVAPFTPEEVAEYLQELSYIDLYIHSEQIQELYKLTLGRPILVGLVTDVLKHRIMTLSELLSIPEEAFESSLVAQINQLEHPVDAIVMFMSHLYHRFNFSMLEWILRESQFTDLLENVRPEELPKQLLNLSFVRSASGKDFVLHDEMRPLVNKYCWLLQDPEQHTRKELSRCGLHYYEQELEHVQQEQLRQSYIVEALYHRLYLDLNEGYKYFRHNFSRATKLLMSAFARSLLREAQQFVGSMSPEQQYELKFSEARLLQKEENAEMALRLLEELEQEADAQWLADHKAEMQFEKGICYRQLSKFPEAISCFSKAMELYKEQGRMASYGFLLNWLGSVYQLQGQLDTALYFYEECMKLQKELGNERVYANTLTSISNVYRFQGKIEEALRRSKIAWRLRYALFKQGRTSEVHVGWSRAAIGAIYLHIDDLAEAEHVFRETYEIFVRTGHKKGIATMYNRFGQIALARQQYKEAQEQFEKAYNTALGIDVGSQIASLNRQGKIAIIQQRWESAMSLLNRAVGLAKKVHDEYQQAECLIELADVLERTEQHEQSQRALAEAEAICNKYNYYYLLGLAKESQAEIKYHRSQHAEALQDYVESCHYMARYNTITYTKTARRVIDALLGVPVQEVVPIADALIKYWTTHGLDKDHPDFVSSCEEVKILTEMQLIQVHQQK
jgi:tetratricopeptide (TPR) repeat protein